LKSRITVTILVGVLGGLFVGLAAYTFLYAKGYSYLTNNPEACANCHVMQAQYEAG
jgi:cytochrome c nitrite reductase small subunit